MCTRLLVLGAAFGALVACVDDVEVPPKPPTVNPVTNPTPVSAQTIRGTRPPNTAIALGGMVVVPAAPETSWEFPVTLQPGDNVFEFFTQRPSGLRSRTGTSVTLTLEAACPSVPSLSAQPPAFTNQRTHQLSGTKPAGTGVAVDGMVVVEVNDATTFTHSVTLPAAEASTTLKLTTVDAKGRKSDPVPVTITYDTTPPRLATRYPTAASDQPAATMNIPTSSSVFVEFSEPVRHGSGMIPADLVTVTAASTPVAGTTTIEAGGLIAVWTPMSSSPGMPPLAANTQFDARVNVAMLVDRAGNAVQPGPSWSWTFRTGVMPSSAAPTDPTAMVPTTTTASVVILSGTREPWSSIWVNGSMRIAPAGNPAFSLQLPVDVGANSFDVLARSPSGVPTAATTLTVSRTVNKPAAPAVDPMAPTMATAAAYSISGTKPAGTAVLIDGVAVTCVNDDTTWGAQLTLLPGVNSLRLTTKNATGDESDPAVFKVDFSQNFSGKVPQAWRLKISMNLNDLRGTNLANEFTTNADNHYGIDIWLEGPLRPTDTCEFDATLKQRKNVKYVATIQHYVGTGNHAIPFADPDYKGTDYIAALASGGILGFRGIAPDAPRRDTQGRELPGVMGGVTVSDLVSKFDCNGVPGTDMAGTMDGCTEASIRDKRTYTVAPWQPRRAPLGELLDQGEYLLWVMINLDRNAPWLTANDTEVCWENPADFNRGMHRVVRRIALGGTPSTVTLRSDAEQSGPDPSGNGPAKFIDSMTISWGPP